MSTSLKNKIEESRLKARRLRLNSFDVCAFNEVPGFIIDAFFGEGTYKTRLLVATFGFLNGIQIEDLLKILHWKPLRNTDVAKIKHLYDPFFKLPLYRKKYYSWSIINKKVMFLDGALRLNGRRIE
jgi:hypothetical protein